MARSRHLDKLDAASIQCRQGSSHPERDDIVRLAVKDVDLRNFLLRENGFQRNFIVEPVPKDLAGLHKSRSQGSR